MQSNLKVQNFEYGTMKVEKDTVTCKISKREFHYTTISELDVLRENNHDDFLKLIKIEESADYIILQYEKPANLKPLHAINNEEQIVKFSIAQKILNQAITSQTSDYVSLNPSTIFYYPMNDVKYSYLAKEEIMPEEGNSNNLERYQALITSILTKFNYSKCLYEKDYVIKKSNELIQSIYKAESIEEMQGLIGNAANYVTYQYVNLHTEEMKKVKKGFIGAISSVVISAAAIFMFLSMNAEEETQQAVAAVKEEMELEQIKAEADTYFESGEYGLALEGYEELDYDKSKLAEKLIEKEQYQLALDTDATSLEKVIEDIYQKENGKAILDLKIEGNQDMSYQLEVEKAIVNYQYDKLQAEVPFISDVNILSRIADAYLAHEDVLSASEIYNKTNDSTIKSKIDIAQKNIDITQEKEELEEMKSSPEENSDGVIQTQEDKIAQLEEELSELEQQES